MEEVDFALSLGWGKNMLGCSGGGGHSKLWVDNSQGPCREEGLGIWSTQGERKKMRPEKKSGKVIRRPVGYHKAIGFYAE